MVGQMTLTHTTNMVIYIVTNNPTLTDNLRINHLSSFNKPHLGIFNYWYHLQILCQPKLWTCLFIIMYNLL